MSHRKNRLAEETSPYLQQHADNPVDWFAWGGEALDKARAEDKPVLLSIGYSACHWCHVMAHESFEDAETAALMNDLFVNIKVDREERPDIDKIYQTAQLLLTQRTGGWPLTMFLAADDQSPFFGGTYFPKEARHGLPAFKEVLRLAHDYYRNHRAEIRDNAAAVRAALGKIYGPDDGAASPQIQWQDAAARALDGLFDPEHGGLGGEPKFPQCACIEWALDYWARGAPPAARARSAHIALFTLERMSRGGVYDQIGGGFYRYSVDERWEIPHFEKMLYDNGPLLGLLARAWSVGGGAMFCDKARETAGWVMREMQLPEGGYCSTLDADSAEGEGAYYVWSEREIDELPQDERQVVRHCYGLERRANFGGRWHLAEWRDAEQAAQHLKRAPGEVRGLLQRARETLFQRRLERTPPARDDKILTGWNALMIKGMAEAAYRFGEPEYEASARRALAFIRRVMWRDGRLLATCRDGHARLNAYLDDYAFLMDAILCLSQARWDGDDFLFAVRLADTLLEQYEDTGRGGFYFTPHDHESLIQRPRVLADEATPSGYGTAAVALGRLGMMLGEERYLRAAARALEQAAPAMQRAPEHHTTLLKAHAEQCDPPEIIILRGDDDTLRQWLAETARHYHPARLCFAIPAHAQNLPPAFADKRAAGAAIAYPCRGTVCDAPLRDFDALAEHLRAGAAKLAE